MWCREEKYPTERTRLKKWRIELKHTEAGGVRFRVRYHVVERRNDPRMKQVPV